MTQKIQFYCIFLVTQIRIPHLIIYHQSQNLLIKQKQNTSQPYINKISIIPLNSQTFKRIHFLTKRHFSTITTRKIQTQSPSYFYIRFSIECVNQPYTRQHWEYARKGKSTFVFDLFGKFPFFISYQIEDAGFCPCRSIFGKGIFIWRRLNISIQLEYFSDRSMFPSRWFTFE